MAKTTILHANEPRAYRDTIATALRMLRPETDAFVTDPERLDEAIVQLAPQVVICSTLTPILELHVPAWLILYPGGTAAALRRLNGMRTAVREIDLDGIISLIDGAIPLSGTEVREPA